MSRLNVTAVAMAKSGQDDFRMVVSVSEETGECTTALKSRNFRISQPTSETTDGQLVGEREISSMSEGNPPSGFYYLNLKALSHAPGQPRTLKPGHHSFEVAVEAGSKKNVGRVETGITATVPTDFGQTIAVGYLPP